MTDELELPVEQENEEDNWPIHVIDNTGFIALVAPEETILYLGRIPILCGIYFGILYLHQKGYLMKWTFKETAEFLKITPKSFQKYINDLEKVGFISIKADEKGWKRKNIMFNRVRRLPDAQIDRLNKVTGAEHQIRVMEELRQQVTTTSFEEYKKSAEQEQAKLFVDTKVKEGVKQELDKRAKVKKAQEQKFPIDDYTSVLDGYRKYKGIFIKPHSPDEGRYRKAAKNMFLSGWKVLDILECMKFFNKYCRNEGYEWMNNWTLETVGKKMAEFKAGNLKRPELGDDLPEYTG